MSDWRSGDNDREPPRKPVKRDTVQSVAPIQQRGKPAAKADWRGRSAPSTSTAAAVEPGWSKHVQTGDADTRKLRRILIVSGILLALCLLTAFFVDWIWRRPPKIPLFWSITSSEYGSADLGETPFGQVQVERAKTNIPTTNIDLSIDSKVSGSAGQKKSGPGKALVRAYLISGHIARLSDSDDAWVLVDSTGDPFGDPTKCTKIQMVLQSIADQTPSNRYALVALDVRPPTVVTNLGDLGFPTDALMKAHEGLSAADQDKIILVLPCQAGQENWSAPEFSSSVFAHFFVEGIAKGFATSKRAWTSSEITLGDFKQGLVAAVQTWVSLNRHARQEPVFRMSAKTESNSDLRIAGTAGISADRRISNATDLDKKTYDQLGDLWKRFVRLSPMRSVDPIEFSKIESQLIHLEELAESTAGASNSGDGPAQPALQRFLAQVAQALTALEIRRDQIPRVSLVEAVMISRARKSESLFGDIAALTVDGKLEDYLVRGAGSPPAENANRNGQCWQVWRLLAEPAKELNKIGVAQQSSSWNDRYTQECLARCLQYVRDPTAAEWLEIQLLRIILHEIDWQAQPVSPFRNEAIARIVGSFDALQSAACAPNPELSLWVKDDVQRLDKSFVQAFDLLIVNDFENCVKLLRGISTDVDSLVHKSNRLSEAASFRDSMIHMTPHLLAAWLREQRHGDSRKMELMEPEELSTLVKLSLDVTDLLRNPQPAALDPRLSTPEILAGQQRLNSLVNSAFARLIEQSDNDPEVLRDSRIALRWPLLEPSLRQVLHTRVMLHQNEVDAPSAAPDQIQFSSVKDRVARAFTKFPEVARAYSRIYEGDPRLSLQNLQSELDRNLRSSTSPLDVAALYQASRRLQVVGNSLGQRGYAEAIDIQQWPWNAPLAFRKYCESQYVRLQTSRLCDAVWGDGDFAQRTSGLYFEELVKLYQVDVDPLKKVPGFEQYAISFDLRELIVHPKEQLASTQVKSITPVSAGAATESQSEILAKEVELASSLVGPGNILALKLGEQSIVPFFEGTCAYPLRDLKTLVIRIKKSDQREKLRLAFRGHSFAKEIPAEEAPKQFTVAFNRITPTAPTVMVTSATEVNSTVSLLLDCSNSMLQPLAGGGKVHDKLKQVVVELLNRIDKLNEENDNVIKVRLFLFGRVYEEDPDTRPAQLQQFSDPVSNQICYTGELECDEVRRILESNWVRPSAKTPLYDAVSAAITLTPNGLNRIVVVSDGANDVEDGINPALNYTGRKISSDELKSKIGASKNCTVYIYQYENLVYYQDRDNRARAEKSIKDLQQLAQDMKQDAKLSFGLHKQVADLSKDLLDSFPSSLVRITPVKDNKEQWSGTFRKPISVATKSTLPLDLNIDAKSVEGVSAEPVRVAIAGNEQLKLIFSLGTLRYITFEEELNDYGFTFPFPLEQRGGNQDLQLHARPIFSADNSEFSVELAMHEKNQRSDFTRRPEFAVLELRLPDSQRSFHFWDFSYQSRHYPILSFPAVRLEPTDRRFELDCWLCVANPAELGLSADLLIPQSRAGNAFSVAVKSPNAERKFVIARGVTTSTRTYSETSDGIRETHQSKLERNSKSYLVPFAKLNEWTVSGKVQHYTLPSQFLPN